MRRAPARGTRRPDPQYAGRALHAEWTKARTAGSTIWLLLAIIATTIAVGSAVAIGIVLGLLYLFPVAAAAVANPHWQRHLEQIAPMSAGLAIQVTTGPRAMPISPWTGLGVLTAWATGAMLAGGLLLRLRDA